MIDLSTLYQQALFGTSKMQTKNTRYLSKGTESNRERCIHAEKATNA